MPTDEPYVRPLDRAQARAAVDALHAAEALCRQRSGPESLQAYGAAKLDAGAWTGSALAEVERLGKELAIAQASAEFGKLAVLERDQARAEVERLAKEQSRWLRAYDAEWDKNYNLNAEVEQLRAALAESSHYLTTLAGALGAAALYDEDDRQSWVEAAKGVHNRAVALGVTPGDEG